MRTAGAAKSQPKPKASADELIARAANEERAGDLAAASRSLDQALAVDPKHRQALLLQAELTQQQGQSLANPYNLPYYLRSADLMRRLRAAHPKPTADEAALLPNVLYNEACALALYGQTDRALASLGAALDAGFARVELLDNDADLDPLRKLPGFVELQRRAERRHVASLLDRSPSALFPFTFRLPGTDAKTVALDDFKGKVTVVHVWGTWCAPARKELPHLAELHRRYHDKGLAIIGVDEEPQGGDEARKTLAEFVKKYEIPYPCVVGDAATRARIPSFAGYPTLLFLDRAGRVRLRADGYQPLGALEVMAVALLEEDSRPEEGRPPGTVP
jgi:thiol-disulfide isomerase/thioredoxin